MSKDNYFNDKKQYMSIKTNHFRLAEKLHGIDLSVFLVPHLITSNQWKYRLISTTDIDMINGGIVGMSLKMFLKKRENDKKKAKTTN